MAMSTCENNNNDYDNNLSAVPCQTTTPALKWTTELSEANIIRYSEGRVLGKLAALKMRPRPKYTALKRDHGSMPSTPS